MDDKLQAKKTYYQQFLGYTEQQILELSASIADQQKLLVKPENNEFEQKILVKKLASDKRKMQSFLNGKGSSVQSFSSWILFILRSRIKIKIIRYGIGFFAHHPMSWLITRNYYIHMNFCLKK